MNHKFFLPVFRLFGPWATSSSFCFRESCLPLLPAHRLFLRLERLIPHQPHRPPRFRIFCAAPGIARSPAFFQIIRPSAVKRSVRTLQKICVVHLPFSLSQVPVPRHSLPRAPQRDLPMLRVPSFTYYVNGNGTMESITVLRKPAPAESI